MTRPTALSTTLMILTLGALFLAAAGCRENAPESEAAGRAPESATPGTKAAPAAREASAMNTPNDAPSRPRRVRSAILAGSWYPGDPRTLAREVDGVVEAAGPPEGEGVFAVIAPHAGYRFSAATAGYAYRALSQRSFRRVILLGPSHRAYVRGLALPEATHFATPLGAVEIDQEAVEALERSPLFHRDGHAHASEHSLEIHVPFLQRIGPKGDGGPAWKLVPIIVGQVDAGEAREAGETLKSLLDDETVVVASSDFTHYGSNYGYVPFREDIEENLRELDMGACEVIERKDPADFLAYRARTGATICGAHPIAVLLAMVPEDTQVRMLHYDTSGRMLSDWANTVSYVAMSFASTSLAGDQVPNGRAHPISAQEKNLLLKLARDTIERWVRDGEKVDPDAAEYGVTERMRELSGAFVTLHKRGQLRGCIGEILPRRPLNLVVRDHAIDAAANDNRFRPVTQDELDDIDIEVSVLTPPYEVPSWKDIVIGRDGVLITKGYHRAVFLPQVASERGWGVEETLGHLAMKAGLPPDGWREGTRFEVFQAIVFHESPEQ